MLHDEVDRLPEKYRLPVILCYLEGKTNEEVAELLHWPVGTVKGRLSRARDLLRSRLVRRGLVLSAALPADGAFAAAESLPRSCRRSWSRTPCSWPRRFGARGPGLALFPAEPEAAAGERARSSRAALEVRLFAPAVPAGTRNGYSS